MTSKQKSGIISESDFQAEVRCAAVMNIVGRMLETGLITEEEREMINTIMLEKYRPMLSMLLSGKPLI